MRRVLILRHGESVWNRESRWQGWVDIDLTPTGERQAVARAEQLVGAAESLVAVYASDLTRARRTAELIAAACGVGPVRIDPGFRERCGGDWQGHTGDEIRARWPEHFEDWRAGRVASPPGGESDTEVWARFEAALVACHDDAPAGPVAVVTHGGALRLVARRAGVANPEIVPNLGGWWFGYDGDRLTPGPPLPELPKISTHSDAAE